MAADTGIPRFVAGVLGPTSRTASISPDVADPAVRNIRFDDLVAAYEDATLGLIEGGSDLLMVETIKNREKTSTFVKTMKGATKFNDGAVFSMGRLLQKLLGM